MAIRVENLIQKEKKWSSSFKTEEEYNIDQLTQAIVLANNFEDVKNKLLLITMSIADADGGTLYFLDKNELHIQLLYNQSLNLKIQPKMAPLKTQYQIALYDPVTKQPNLNYAIVRCVMDKLSINIPDIHQEPAYEISGSSIFDVLFDYKTTSLLNVPLCGSDGIVLGAIQLVNARNASKHVIPFPKNIQSVIENLCQKVMATPIHHKIS